MEQKEKKNRKLPAEPLTTRHVFLDTQVYRSLNHNAANPVMTLLNNQIDAHRIVVHTTDITLLEIKRQIKEQVLSRQRELNAIEKDLNRWRKAAPKSVPPKSLELEAKDLTDELFENFSQFLLFKCNAKLHEALKVSPATVFGMYFDRLPPFDGEDNKEFPDGFVLQALKQWCAENNNTINIVTKDKAVLRAASIDERLIPINDIHELLARAAADLDFDGEKAVEEVIYRPEFDMTFEASLEKQIEDITYTYVGDLPEGEAYEGELVSIDAIDGWSVVGLSESRVTMILNVRVTVQVEIQYEDRSGAVYDREDDMWFGAEIASTTIEDEIEIEVLVDVERKSAKVKESKIITRDAIIYDNHDWEK